MSVAARAWARSKRQKLKPGPLRLLYALTEAHRDGQPLRLFTPLWMGIDISFGDIKRWAEREPQSIRDLDGIMLDRFVLHDQCRFGQRDHFASALLDLQYHRVLVAAREPELARGDHAWLGVLDVIEFPMGSEAGSPSE